MTLKLIKKTDEKQYKLIGLLHHIGNDPRSGHYIAYTKMVDAWYKHDDTSVTRVGALPGIDTCQLVAIYEMDQ